LYRSDTGEELSQDSKLPQPQRIQQIGTLKEKSILNSEREIS